MLHLPYDLSSTRIISENSSENLPYNGYNPAPPARTIGKQSYHPLEIKQPFVIFFFLLFVLA
jgi:hypothetical protein